MEDQAYSPQNRPDMVSLAEMGVFVGQDMLLLRLRQLLCEVDAGVKQPKQTRRCQPRQQKHPAAPVLPYGTAILLQIAVESQVYRQQERPHQNAPYQPRQQEGVPDGHLLPQGCQSDVLHRIEPAIPGGPVRYYDR